MSCENWAAVKGLGVPSQVAICSSTAGIRSLVSQPSWVAIHSHGGALGEEANDADEEENNGNLDHRVDEVEKGTGDWGVGVEKSIPSMSPSMISSSLSAEGKKFRKSASACHLDAFLNSIQTSMWPGQESVG